MDDATIIDFAGRDGVIDPLTDLLRKGARELLQAAIVAERDTFLAEFAERRTADGRAAVVGSGYHPERVKMPTLLSICSSRRSRRSTQRPPNA